MESSFTIGTVLVQKAPAALADRLREAILTGALADGAQLPPERALAEQSGRSRGSVREALRLLEADGLVVMRSGRYGGAIVRRPTSDSVERLIVSFIRGRPIPAADYVETRLAVESAVARLAARNRADDDLAKLAAINERIATSPEREDRVAANVDWHIALAAAARNELLGAIVNALAATIYTMTSSDKFHEVENITALTVKSHQRVYDAIAARDPDAAERRLRRHILGSAAIGGV